VTVTLDTAAKGVLANLGGFTDAGNAVYQFVGTAAEATDALRGLVFVPAENRLPPGQSETTTFTITVHDGVVSSAVSDASTTVRVQSVNDAPVNVLPGLQTIRRNGSLAVAAAQPLRVTDVDAGANPVQVQLAANAGVLSVRATAGVAIAGNGTAAVTLTGNLAAVNAALLTLTYFAPFGFTGTVRVTTTTTDLSPNPPSLQDLDAFFIGVANTRPSTTPAGLPGTFAYSVFMNQPLSVTPQSGVLRGARDSDGDSLAAVLLTPPEAGSVSLSADGSFVYLPPTGFMGTVRFFFRYFDGLEFSDPIQVVLNVAGPTDTGRRR
jgi:hypothetical protein